MASDGAGLRPVPAIRGPLARRYLRRSRFVQRLQAGGLLIAGTGHRPAPSGNLPPLWYLYPAWHTGQRGMWHSRYLFPTLLAGKPPSCGIRKIAAVAQKQASFDRPGTYEHRTRQQNQHQRHHDHNDSGDLLFEKSLFPKGDFWQPIGMRTSRCIISTFFHGQ